MKTNWKLFGVLLAASVFGSVAVLPLVLHSVGGSEAIMEQMPPEMSSVISSLPMFFVVGMVQTLIMFGILIYTGLKLGEKMGLQMPILVPMLEKKSPSVSFPALAKYSVLWGVVAGVLIIGGDFVFSFFLTPFSADAVPVWKGFLASFYGGITEEVVMRLFLMTFLAWIFSFFTRSKGVKSSAVMWGAILVSAILFGVGHLPATAQLTELTPGVILRGLLLNGVGAFIFGWLYWKKGFESAVIAHFSTDIVLHVIYAGLMVAL